MATREHRDTYADLLRETRGLKNEQALAREEWFSALAWQRKEQTLFALEMSLKGLVCFGNPHNHAGLPSQTTLVARDFREETRVIRDTLDRIIRLTRQLLGSKDRTYTFTKYLQSVIPEDLERNRLVKEQLTQDTPQESLMLLRNVFGAFRELADGLFKLDHVNSRLFFALHGAITREIERNVFFNPLVDLEFRPEFDRIQLSEVLDALGSISSNTAHRVVALTFLVLFRSLRYMDMIDGYAAEQASAHLAHCILAVARSDLRALTRYLGSNIQQTLAEGLEREILQIQASFIKTRHFDIHRDVNIVLPLRRALVTLSHSLDLEVRKIYEEDFPGPGSIASGEELGSKLTQGTVRLRAAIQHFVRTLCAEVRPDLKPPRFAETPELGVAQSQRLRRETWMFSQVVRAFLAKAGAIHRYHDSWEGSSPFGFVWEFLRHFDAIGYQVLRLNDYSGLDVLVSTLNILGQTDLFHTDQLKPAMTECAKLLQYLETCFVRLSQQDDLRQLPFNKHEAADLLRRHLGITG